MWQAFDPKAERWRPRPPAAAPIDDRSLVLVHWKRVRYDRIFLRTPSFQPKSIEILGQQPSPTGVFISDHFGLKLEIHQKR